jgi:hypothetical protein
MYAKRINVMQALSGTEKQQLVLELDTLRAELDDVRTKFAALLAKMDTDFVNVTNASVDYASSCALATATFTKN